MTRDFSISEALEFGWRKTRAHSGLLFQILLTIFALDIAYQMVMRVLGGTLEGFLASLALLLASVVVGTGFMVIVLKLARGQHTSYKDIVPPARVVVVYACASLVAAAVILVGFVLLIVPGVYLLLRYSMVKFSAVDGSGVTQSLRTSALMTQDVKWHLLGFILVIIALNIIGAVLLLVGLLVSVPVTMLAYAHVYQQLHGRVEGKA
jgi:uncharacterized membrane protein